MALDAVITTIQDVVRQVPGIGASPDNPPSQELRDPVLLVYPGDATSWLGTSVGAGGVPNRWDFETIMIDVFVYVADELEIAFQRIRPFADPVRKALFDAFARDKFGGTVAGLGDVTNRSAIRPYRRSSMSFMAGGINVLGYHHELDVTYQEVISR